MSYHIVHVGSPTARLNCRDGQLTCETEDGDKSLPMEDVASVVVTSFSATIHSEVLLQAAENGVAFIYCRNFKPVSLVLPANRATDTQLTRALIRLSPKLRARLWQSTVDAKCWNQYALAGILDADEERQRRMHSCAAGCSASKEASCARFFWGIFGRFLGEAAFVRGRKAGGFNDQLNFGYAVVLSLVLRNLYAVGLDPTFGIFHKPRERATPLAYDLMEPFRPVVDAGVCEWARECPDNLGVVTVEFKRKMLQATESPIRYAGRRMSVRAVIERSVRSFRAAVLAGRADLYRPWTLRNSKWAG